MEGHGGLRLGPEALCRPVLRGETAVTLREDQTQSVKREPRARRTRASLSAPTLETEGDETLFQALRALRLRLAKEQNVPPYVIFHDTTLLALSKARPQNLQAMAEIQGIGAAKLERYGQVFLEAVRTA